MAVCWLIEGRGDDLGIDTRCHIGDLLGTLVDEQDDHVDLGVVSCDGVGDILEQDSLTRLGLSDDQTTLSLTYGGKEVYDTHRYLVLYGGVTWGLKLELLVGEDRGEVVEGDTVTHLRGCTTIDSGDLVEGEVLIPLLWWTDKALHEVSWT